MPRLRYADLVRQPMDVVALTGLTPDEFQRQEKVPYRGNR